jgi:hypothetical protein
MATYCCVLWDGQRILATACMVDYPGNCPPGWTPFLINECTACPVYPSRDEALAALEQSASGSSAYAQADQETSVPPFADQFG